MKTGDKISSGGFKWKANLYKFKKNAQYIFKY